MRVLRHHLGPLLALLAALGCAAAAAVPAWAAGASPRSSSGSSATGGSSAGTGSGATGGSKASAAGQTSTAANARASQTMATTVARSGIATWYGPGLYGHKTACGQMLTPGLIGLASRTLPCGTLVKVSYDGRSRIVPVLDRGPYAGNGASWDLTAGAADALEITETVRITTLVVGAAPNSPTLGAPAVTSGEAAFGGAQAGS
jgi:rare lipoprotein A (peptidoglycan hydrolase)